MEKDTVIANRQFHNQISRLHEQTVGFMATVKTGKHLNQAARIVCGKHRIAQLPARQELRHNASAASKSQRSITTHQRAGQVNSDLAEIFGRKQIQLAYIACNQFASPSEPAVLNRPTETWYLSCSIAMRGTSQKEIDLSEEETWQSNAIYGFLQREFAERSSAGAQAAYIELRKSS
jgi:hypothetical protein